MRVNAMLSVQVHKGTDRADQAFGDIPISDDLTGQHRIQQLGQLSVENLVQGRMDRAVHRRSPLPENGTNRRAAVPTSITMTMGRSVPETAEPQTGPCSRRRC